MRILFGASLLFAASASVSASASASPTRDDWKELVLGLFEGAFGPTEKVAEKCIDEGEETIATLEKAVQDIREGSDESVQDGIELIGQAVREAAQDLQDCEEAAAEVEDLIDMAEMLEHPWSFMVHARKNIVVNHVEILDEVTAAVDAWDSDPKDFRAFGFNVGEILEQVFLEDEGSEAVDSVPAMMA